MRSFRNPHAIFAGAPPGNTSGRSSKYRKLGGGCSTSNSSVARSLSRLPSSSSISSVSSHSGANADLTRRARSNGSVCSGVVASPLGVIGVPSSESTRCTRTTGETSVDVGTSGELACTRTDSASALLSVRGAALTSALDRAAWLASAETIPDLSVLSFVGVSPAPATEKAAADGAAAEGAAAEGPGDPGGINAAGTGAPRGRARGRAPGEGARREPRGDGSHRRDRGGGRRGGGRGGAV